MITKPATDRRMPSSETAVLEVGSRTARWLGAAAVIATCCWLLILLTAGHHHLHRHGQLAWSLTIAAAIALIVRGVFMGRPVTATHAIAAMLILLGGLGMYLAVGGSLSYVMVVAAGWVLMWPTGARPQPDALPQVWALVSATESDPLAPFALQSLKSYHFNPGGTAVLAYRTRIGYAVVSGDPIGDEAQFPALVADFVAMCRRRGWRIMVLGASHGRLELWRDTATAGQSFMAVPIGRDVVIDPHTFNMVGRKYRNLRQAVQRTRNRGITSEVIAEQDIDDGLRGELAEVLYGSHHGARFERGFSMILDGALEGRYPGVELIIGRDRRGRVQGFHRYGVAGGGSDVTLDVPWRRPGAPNGIDERLCVDMIDECRRRGVQRLSLALAPFPEIFGADDRGLTKTVICRLIHLLDPFIGLESLYRYVRKFHAYGQRRYALMSPAHLLAAAFVLISLELVPHRRRALLHVTPKQRE